MVTLENINTVPSLNTAIDALRHFCEQSEENKVALLARIKAIGSIQVGIVWSTVSSLLMFYAISGDKEIAPYEHCLVDLYNAIVQWQ